MKMRRVMGSILAVFFAFFDVQIEYLVICRRELAPQRAGVVSDTPVSFRARLFFQLRETGQPGGATHELPKDGGLNPA